MSVSTDHKSIQQVDTVTIRFAGDSGDGMQIAGDRFTSVTAQMGNDIATLPDFPAEIRAPAGSLPGVSGFQLHFADHDILTPGDAPNVLVAMNPAALKTNVHDVEAGGAVIVNSDAFTKGNLRKAKYDTDPLSDGSLERYQIFQVPLTTLTVGALQDTELGKKDKERCKNFFALGLMSWMYSRPTQSTIDWISEKFAKRPDLVAANITVFKAGYAFGETTELFTHAYRVKPAKLPEGRYRQITGNLALAYGLVAAAERSGLPLFMSGYPITPASDILHELSKHKNFGVRTLQAEDEIAAVGMALGASFAGNLAVTATSGPGVALKAETIGLAVSVELPLVIVNIQRGGPSTGLPTKTEQSDLLQALFGRNGEAPVPVVAADTPGGCFHAALEAARIAITYRTPVILLSDGYLANGAEPWRIPVPEELPDLTGAVRHATARQEEEPEFLPFARDPDTLARPWAIPGTAGLEHRIGGIEKADETGNISYDPENHHHMTELRKAKVEGVARSIPPLVVDVGPEGGPTPKVLVVGWGSTYGPIKAAVRRCRAEGMAVAQAHLHHLNPMPTNTGDVLASFDRVLVPEMNMGQLRMLLRARYLVDVQGYNRVTGLPFTSIEIANAITREVRAADGLGEPAEPLSTTAPAPVGGMS